MARYDNRDECDIARCPIFAQTVNRVNRGETGLSPIPKF
jgi:hypothetical protein